MSRAQLVPTCSAHFYADLGWPVIPIEPKGKIPLARLVRHGVKHATTDSVVIHEWWSKQCDANIGVACKDALCVLDVDPRNGGEIELERLCAEHGALPLTPQQRTGSGGHHFVFQHPGVPLRGKVGPGLDLLHGDKYFLVAPSVHPNGGRYTWTTEPTQTPSAPLPEWLLELARRPAEIADTAKNGSRTVVVRGTQTNITARALAYALAIPPAISGQGGHSQTFMACCRVARGFSLNADEAFTVMSEWNRNCQPPWTERELRRKIDQALEHGRVPFGAMLEERA
ncbi:MAG TPA: bifunctional DNA primase/polymerase [Polyangiaceae bacterium]|jgi:hypothetical protein